LDVQTSSVNTSATTLANKLRIDIPQTGGYCLLAKWLALEQTGAN